MNVEATTDGISFAAVTHRGFIRESNEDAICCPGCILHGESKVSDGLTTHCPSVFMIADGMGGHAKGEVASIEALTFLEASANQAKETDWMSLLTAANDHIFDLMSNRPDLVGMGTTIVGVEIGSEETTFFNVGDSRAYSFLDHKLLRVSTDDVPARSGVRSHQITQSLGGRLSRTRIMPHLRKIGALEPGNGILLCSDGLSDMISEREMESILAKFDRPIDAARSLLDAALQAGGRDNVSVVVVRRCGQERHSLFESEVEPLMSSALDF